MKFSNLLFLTGLATASPLSPQIQPREQTVVGTVADAVSDLVAVGNQDLQQIVQVINAVKDSTEVIIEAQIKAIVKEDLQEITDAIKQATDIIAEASAEAAAKIAQGLEDLAQVELEILAEAIDAATKFVVQVEAVLSVSINGLSPAAQLLVNAEVGALKEALKPFVTPLLAFIQAIQNLAVAIGLQVDILVKAGDGFTAVLAHFLKSLGLDLLPHA